MRKKGRAKKRKNFESREKKEGEEKRALFFLKKRIFCGVKGKQKNLAKMKEMIIIMIRLD